MCLCPLESSWALVAGISVPFSNTGSEHFARKLDQLNVTADTFRLDRGVKLHKPLAQSSARGFPCACLNCCDINFIEVIAGSVIEVDLPFQLAVVFV